MGRREGVLAPRMERVAARHAALEAWNPNLPAAHIIESELGRFAEPEAVPVDEIEEQPVADVALRDRAKEPFDLFPRVIRDVPLRRGSVVRHPDTAGDSDAFPHFRQIVVSTFRPLLLFPRSRANTARIGQTPTIVSCPAASLSRGQCAECVHGCNRNAWS